MAPNLAAQLVTLSLLSLQRQTYHNRRLNRPSWKESYDYIVIGAGTAGAIVAGRLSENETVTVLLIEAGGPMGIMNDIPGAFWMLAPAWNYLSIPQKHSDLDSLGYPEHEGIGLLLEENRKVPDSFKNKQGLDRPTAPRVFYKALLAGPRKRGGTAQRTFRFSSPMRPIPPVLRKSLVAEISNQMAKSQPGAKRTMQLGTIFGFAFANNRIPLTRGRIVGGSHSINMMGYTRGNSREFDRWASEYGATGWNYASVLPFFLKTENNTDPTVVRANPRLHSTSGPLEVSTLPAVDPFVNRWLRGTEALGWPALDFAQSETQYGGGLLQATQSATNWTRQTTFAAFIEVNIARPNLHVLVHSHVTRLLFSPSAPSTVSGVEFLRQGTLHTVSASRAVVLSAGVINSAQILLLSGIGPRTHLREMGIPLRADLPVGRTLYDHVTALSDAHVRLPTDVTLSASTYERLNGPNLADFFANSTGPLAGLPLTELYTATGINGDHAWPDGLLWFIFAQILSGKLEQYLSVFRPEARDAWRQYYRPFTDSNQHLFFGASLVRPRSCGSVRLASRAPLDAPLIDYNFLENGADLAALVEVLRTFMRILESPVMAPYLAYSTLPVPGCTFCGAGEGQGRPLSACTSYLVCAARTFTIAMFHPTSSCPMGNRTSDRAVVDERLRVRGVGRLRVMDASVMPMVVNTNTNAATMMIAERGVHLLREDDGLL